MSSERTLDLTINRSQIVDQMAAWLYANNTIPDNEDVTNIQFKELFGASDTELVPLKIFLKKHREVRVINHNA